MRPSHVLSLARHIFGCWVQVDRVAPDETGAVARHVAGGVEGVGAEWGAHAAVEHAQEREPATA